MGLSRSPASNRYGHRAASLPTGLAARHFLPVVRKVVETKDLLYSLLIGGPLDDLLGVRFVPIDPEGRQFRRKHGAVLLSGEGAEDAAGGKVDKREAHVGSRRVGSTVRATEDPERMVGAALNLNLVRLPPAIRLYQDPEPVSGPS